MHLFTNFPHAALTSLLLEPIKSPSLPHPFPLTGPASGIAFSSAGFPLATRSLGDLLVHQNPVKHGLVAVANQYPWCSAGWFERTAKPAQLKTIYGFKIDKLKLLDDYDVAVEW